MLEYGIILVIVGWAVWLVVRRLQKESRGEGCTSCVCGRPPQKSLESGKSRGDH